MTDCCCPGPTFDAAEPTRPCSGCGGRGHTVDELTVKAMLTHAALRRFEAGAYRFCPDPACPVVYFDRAGLTFTTADLRVSVWQKQPSGHRTICYCFDENEAGISAEIKHQGVSAAIDRVRQHIAAGRCACEVRNPRGACCLGDLTAAVERVRASAISNPKLARKS